MEILSWNFLEKTPKIVGVNFDTTHIGGEEVRQIQKWKSTIYLLQMMGMSIQFIESIFWKQKSMPLE